MSQTSMSSYSLNGMPYANQWRVCKKKSSYQNHVGEKNGLMSFLLGQSGDMNGPNC